MVKNPDQLNRELREFTKILTDSFNIFAIVLYGSYAESRAGEYSDIDLAVFSEDFGNNPFEEMKSLFKLRRKIDTDIEPLPFNRKAFFENSKTDFVNEILAKGKIIYKEGKLFI